MSPSTGKLIQCIHRELSQEPGEREHRHAFKQNHRQLHSGDNGTDERNQVEEELRSGTLAAFLADDGILWLFSYPCNSSRSGWLE